MKGKSRRWLALCLASAILMSLCAGLGFLPAAAQDAGFTLQAITDQNTSLIPANRDNLLAGARLFTGTPATGNESIPYLSDGLIYTITGSDDADLESRISFWGTEADVTDRQGDPVDAAGGWATVGFEMPENTAVSRFLIAGSADDNPNFSGKNNRHVLLAELYVSNTSELFIEENFVCEINNVTALDLAYLVTLKKPVVGKYVGFRITTGQYRQARVTEMGIYGQEMSDCMALTEKNLFLLDMLGTNTLSAGASSVSGGVDGLPALYDGKIAGITEKEAPAAVVTAQDGTFTLDMGHRVLLDKLLIAGTPDCPLTTVELYIASKTESLFDAKNKFYTLNNTAKDTATVIYLEKLARGRFVGIRAVGTDSKIAIGELGLYGQAGGSEEILTMDEAEMLYYGRIEARTIDNKTAIQDAKGTPGAGNTGAINCSLVKPYLDGEVALLTDGDINTRCAMSVNSPSENEENRFLVQWDTRWLVFAFYLGNEISIDEITLYSSNEPSFFIGGVQYYASYKYADLFKNESLLFTTGGEYYDYDEATGQNAARSSADAGKRAQTYTLTPEQKKQNYRYVAFVVTRPYNTQVNGWNFARMTELSVMGTIAKEEFQPVTTFTAPSSFGDVTMYVQPFDHDDTDYYSTIDHLVVEESALPANISPSLESNCFAVENNKLIRAYLVDKYGKPVTSDKARQVELYLHPNKPYTLTSAVLRDGVLQRVYNSYTHPDGLLKIGNVHYGVAEEATISNKAKATLQSTDVTFALLRYNDLETINKLNGEIVNPSVGDFKLTGTAGAATAGAEDSSTPSYQWLTFLPLLLVLVIAAVVLLIGKGHYRKRQERHAAKAEEEKKKEADNT